MITVSIISPKVSLNAINQVIDHQRFDCVFHKYIYEKLDDIASIYEQCKDSCDVIFCSGELGYNRLMEIPDLKLPCTFVSYEEKHILSIFLNFVIEHPGIPLNRVYCDFLTPLNDFMRLNSYLPQEQMPYCFESDNYIYEELIARTEYLWHTGKIDIMLTRSTNIVPKFDEIGVPYIHILPTESMIAESIQNAVDGAKLLTPDYQICVIIKLLYPDRLPLQEQEYLEISMYKYILDFRKEQDVFFNVNRNFGRFELVSSSNNWDESTENVQNVISYLTKKGDMEFRLGAGIAKTLDESHYHAEIALQESIRYGKNDGFLIHSRSSSLTGPLSLADNLSYSYANQPALEYAQKNGINESNLLKIVGLFKRNNQEILTAASLSKWLNITPRSCNRIMMQLLESGLIEEIAPLKPKSKGRPTRQYRFKKDNCERSFFNLS